MTTVTTRRNPMVDRVMAPATGGSPAISSTPANLRILTCTWNVGNSEPSTLEPWIPTHGSGYDIIVVGCQESAYKPKGLGRSTSLAESTPDGAAAEEEIDSDNEEETRAKLLASSTAMASATSAATVTSGAGAGVGAAASTAVTTTTATGGAGVSPQPVAADASSSTEPSRAHLPANAGLALTGFFAGMKTAAERGAEDGGATGALRAVAGYAKSTPNVVTTSPFFEAVKTHVGPDFEVIRALLMWQIGLIVLVRRTHLAGIQNVETGVEATGLMGITPNKGGCAISLRAYGVPLCFVSSHLAAHMNHNVARHRNAEEIANNIRLGHWHIDFDASHHHTIWMGDLNYRVDLRLADDPTVATPTTETPEKIAEVTTLVQQRRFDRLKAGDQLANAMRAGVAFSGYSEAPIEFAPTFKVKKRQAGCVYADKRTPSWCDRVLFKSQAGRASLLSCTEYSAFPEIITSDHKPVRAAFSLAIRPSIPVSLWPADSSMLKSPFPRLCLTDVSGSDLLAMDYTGTSDVYLMFFSDPDSLIRSIKPTPAPPRTAVKPRTLSPSWKGSTLPDAHHYAYPAGASAPTATITAAGLVPAPASPRRPTTPTAVASTAGAGTAATATATAAGAEDIPPLWICAESPEQLAYAHLILVVMDKDLQSDDRMGQVVLPLGPVASAGGRPVLFDLPVTKAGVTHGHLRGTLRIFWPIVGRSTAAHSTEASKSRDGWCCCTVQ